METNGHPVLTNEAAALGILKSKIKTKGLPTLDISEALNSHLEAYPQTFLELVEKLGLSHRRSLLTQIRRLCMLPPEIKKTLEGKVLGSREIRRLQPHGSTDDDADAGDDTDDNTLEGGDNTGVNTGVNTDQGVETGDNTVYLGDNTVKRSPQGVNTVTTGVNTRFGPDHLIRDTINAVCRVFIFWVKDQNFGQLVERWGSAFQQMGWLKLLLGAVALTFAWMGGWHFQREVVPGIRQKWFARSAAAAAVRTPGQPGLFHPVQLTGRRWISGHRLELRWTPTAGAETYRVYWRSPDGNNMRSLGLPVKTLGAIISAGNVLGKGLVSVTAIGPNEEESPDSQLVEFVSTPMNYRDSVEPLPLEGHVASPEFRGPSSVSRKAASNSKAVTRNPKPAVPLLSPPTELHVNVESPDLIRISWRAVAPNARYNAYSSANRELTNLRKENEHPLKSNQVTWVPETGLDRYWLVVTTLDPQDHESAYSEAVEVIRRPEKGRNSGLLDGAAGAVRKALPW